MSFTSKLFGRRTKSDFITLKSKESAKGRVLLSYITNPFQMSENDRLSARHTNRWECWCIADLLCEMGYDVDVIDYREIKMPRHDYNCIIDIHGNLGKWHSQIPRETKKILHTTGAHWLVQNLAELTRLEMLKTRRGCTLLPRRISQPVRGIEYANCGSYGGNSFVKDSFAFANKPMYRRPPSTIRTFDAPRKDTIELRRNHFLWLGSSGAVHKGLDLVLEAFSGLPECHLSVCGPVDKEDDFIETYHEELFNRPNIHFAGWVDLFGKPFEDLVASTIGIVYPSCSDGCAKSVVACMHAGVLPIVTYESGVDIQDFGLPIDANIENIRAAAVEVSSMPHGEMLSRSQATWEYARAVYTRDAFRLHYGNFLHQILA